VEAYRHRNGSRSRNYLRHPGGVPKLGKRILEPRQFVNWPICSVATRRGGRLGAEVNCYPGYGCMSKKQGKKESGKATLARVKEDLAKPRMAKSARKEEVNQAAARVVRGKRGKTKL
jgi:hypothetical protein